MVGLPGDEDGRGEDEEFEGIADIVRSALAVDWDLSEISVFIFLRIVSVAFDWNPTRGATMLTLLPNGASSRDIERDQPICPRLAATWGSRSCAVLMARVQMVPLKIKII